MQISNLTIIPAIAALGEQIRVEFDITADIRLEYGLYLDLGKLKRRVQLRDEDWTLNVNSTEHISLVVDVESGDGTLESTLATSRAVAETAWTISSTDTVGFPNTAQINNPITYINVRCSPEIELLEVERSSNGEPDESGVYLMFDGKLSLTPNADLSSMRLLMYYAENTTADTTSPVIDLTSSVPALLNGVADDASIVERAFSNASAWNFLLVFGDAYENVSLRRNIFKAFANLHLSGRQNGGVAMGGFSSATDTTPKFECFYPAYFYGGIALGGMKDFSTEEVNTGVKWLNGKTVYAKTLVYTGAAGNTAYSLDLPEGVEMAWLDTSNSIHINYNGATYSPNAIVSNVAVFLCILSDTSVVFRTGLATGGDFYIRVFYTKTDDAPEDISSIALYDADGLMVADAEGKTIVTGMTYTSKHTGSQIDYGVERAIALKGLPDVTDTDDGKVLTVKDGAWMAVELPKYEGEYSVTPNVEGFTLLTGQKFVDSDIKVEKIPYSEVSNTSNGITATIG